MARRCVPSPSSTGLDVGALTVGEGIGHQLDQRLTVCHRTWQATVEQRSPLKGDSRSMLGGFVRTYVQ